MFNHGTFEFLYENLWQLLLNYDYYINYCICIIFKLDNNTFQRFKLSVEGVLNILFSKCSSTKNMLLARKCIFFHDKILKHIPASVLCIRLIACVHKCWHLELTEGWKNNKQAIIFSLGKIKVFSLKFTCKIWHILTD